VFSKTKIPTVYTEHNMQDRYHIITKTLNKLTYNSQSLALGVSDDVSRSINTYIKPKIPVKTLLNGVNTKSFLRNPEAGIQIKESLGIPNGALVIGNVAVFRFQKRLVEWLQAFKKIEEKNPDVYGIIVGFGPLEQDVKAEVERLNLGEKVFFPGLQTEVIPYFSAMDIFMMSSSFEGLPIALLEAMSMECAVLATDAGGIKEVIRDKQDGMICKVEEWKELSELCQVLIDDPGQLAKLKSAARQRVVDSFSLTKMVDELEEIYESLSPQPPKGE
jgi:glycosyltransferase involved in cell wall biosynthesis